MKKCIAFLAFFSFCLSLSSQSLYKVAFEEKVQSSSLIIEGRVVEKQSFWNPSRTMIFTANKVEIYKVFKGSVQSSTVEIITQGGSVDTESVEASDLLTLEKGEIGTFFCFPDPLKLKSPNGNLLFDVYSSMQGFFKYDLYSKQASAPFVRYTDIKTLYEELVAKTGRPYENLRADFSIDNFSQTQRPQAVSITGFSPTTVNAGATIDPSNNLLTITGSGFGTASGSAAVLFDDANDGTGGTAYTVAYNDPLIVSWSTTQIQLRVPSRAGTGTISVRDDLGAVGNSATALQVRYSILTASFNISGTNITKESNLMNDNGSGGYTILYSTNTAGSGVNLDVSPIKQTFQRALTTWREINGINFSEGGTTTSQAISASDGLNVVMMDNTNTGVSPLAAGVLAVCYSRNSMCGNTSLEVQKTEFDIVIRNSGVSSGTTTFTIGPCPPLASDFNETDLETVLLHELGHALNLGHINDSYEGSFAGQLNPSKLMNYAVVNSVKRVSPDYSAKTGAAYAALQQGNAYGSCGLASGEMTPLAITSESKDDCPISFPATSTPTGTVVAFNLTHATSNKFSDPSYTQIQCNTTGTAITNNAYYAIRTNNSGSLNLSVSSYSTTPSSLTSCTQVYAGVPVTGVRLSLYQVSSCPTAGAFPTAVACRTFTANGALSPITGLTANTNYLIYVDGIENTKANFNLTFSGSVLPIKLSSFYGLNQPSYNEIFWKAEMVQNVRQVILQKSADAIVFSDLTTISNYNEMMNGTAKDFSPHQQTYYRLLTINDDGSTEYSKTISIKRNKTNEIIVFPVPAKEIINVQINSNEKFTLSLVNSLGQVVYRLDNISGNQTIRIPVKKFAKGLYELNILKEDRFIEARKIIIE